MLYCRECESRMNITVNSPVNQPTIMYVDTDCPKCGARYTGTLKRMIRISGNKEEEVSND